MQRGNTLRGNRRARLVAATLHSKVFPNPASLMFLPAHVSTDIRDIGCAVPGAGSKHNRGWLTYSAGALSNHESKKFRRWMSCSSLMHHLIIRFFLTSHHRNRPSLQIIIDILRYRPLRMTVRFCE